MAQYSRSRLLRLHVHGLGIDEPLVKYEGSGTTSKTWPYADQQGCIVGEANSPGTKTAVYAYCPHQLRPWETPMIRIEDIFLRRYGQEVSERLKKK